MAASAIATRQRGCSPRLHFLQSREPSLFPTLVPSPDRRCYRRARSHCLRHSIGASHERDRESRRTLPRSATDIRNVSPTATRGVAGASARPAIAAQGGVSGCAVSTLQPVVRPPQPITNLTSLESRTEWRPHARNESHTGNPRESVPHRLERTVLASDMKRREGIVTAKWIQVNRNVGLLWIGSLLLLCASPLAAQYVGSLAVEKNSGRPAHRRISPPLCSFRPAIASTPPTSTLVLGHCTGSALRERMKCGIRAAISANCRSLGFAFGLVSTDAQ